jgi:hypothetical protein
VDSLVAPAGVVSGHLLNQEPGRWLGVLAVGVCPVPGGQPPVPAEDRDRRDESVGGQRSRQVPDQGGEHCPVGPVQPRLRVLSAKDRVLVAKDQDLRIFGRAGLGEEGKPAGDAAEHEVEQA